MLLLLLAAAADSHFTASSPLPQASAWSAALNVQLDASPSFCSCSPVSQQQPNHEPFTYCHWACGAVAGDQVTVSALQQLGQRFKACTVSLITGEEYLEGAAVMSHSYAAAFNENERYVRLRHCCRYFVAGNRFPLIFFINNISLKSAQLLQAQGVATPPPPLALLHSQSSRCTQAPSPSTPPPFSRCCGVLPLSMHPATFPYTGTIF
jgi:hypothetical protein